jgi:hypothetical protein
MHFRIQRIKKARPRTEWLVRVTGLAGVVTIILALLGFGVTLSVESWGAIPNNALYTSPSELIALSSVAIGTFIARSGRTEILRQIVVDIVPYAGVWAGVVALGLLLLTWPGAPAVVRARQFRHWTINRLRTHFARGSRSRATVNALAGLIGVPVVVPIIVAVYFLLAVTAACLLAAVPLFGYTAGKLYIEEWVVGPARCHYDAGKKREKVAMCVTVTTKELGTFIGRVVYSTSSVIVLYVRAPGSPSKTVRVPLAEAVVEARRSDAQ